MNATAYELLAAIAKYWFIALALFILVRLILSVTREMRIEHQVQKEIGRAGTSVNATLVLLSDEERRLKRGKLYAVSGETTIGRSMRCDVTIKNASLQGMHCILNMERDGMSVVPVGRAFVVVDGEPVEKRALALDGSQIQMGGLIFRLRLEEIDGIEQ